MENTRYSTIDYLKFYAILAVVCGHTTPFLEIARKVYFLIDTLPKMAVPFFFTVSGFLFGLKIRGNKQPEAYFQRYIKKIAALYFSWTLFYFITEYGINIRTYSEALVLSDLAAWMKLFASVFYLGFTGMHLWFLIALFWSVVILFVFVRYDRLKELLIASFCLNIIGLFGNSYAGVWAFPLSTRDALFYGLFYCTLGCFFAFNDQLRERIARVRPSYIAVAAVTFTLLQMVERAVLMEYFNGDMFDDYIVSSIPLTICLLSLVIVKPNLGQNSLLTRIGKKSLGIYVIHLFVFGSLSSIFVTFLGFNPKQIIYQLLLTPLVFVTSYYAYEILQLCKLPLLAWLKRLKEETFYLQRQ